MKTHQHRRDAAPKLHPENRHHGRYPIPTLIEANPSLKSFVQKNPRGQLTVDFHSPEAVVALNTALLKHFYNVQYWSIPNGYLCPPIPGRADYLHYLSDLLEADVSISRQRPKNIRVLDIGTGANIIYPLLGSQLFGWSFVASDVDNTSISCAKQTVAQNPHLRGRIDVRRQAHNNKFFDGVVHKNEYFHLSMCNPPFHRSKAEADQGTRRKNENLNRTNKRNPSQKKALNFGGQSNELWCQGGELEFVQKMIRESVSFQNQVGWFTSLVSKAENVSPLKREARKADVKDFRIVNMRQGQKISRFIAWTFEKKGS